MKAGIYFNKNYISDNRVNIGKLSRKLTDCGVENRVVEGFSDLDGLDMLFVLGGDGTILLVAAECALRGIKIVGINYGHVGFLTEFEPETIDRAVEVAVSGNYVLQKRSMLEIECDGKKYFALNDLVIQRKTFGDEYMNTVNLHAEIDGVTVDNFSSDGIIISTPTGSTAYSLAAGGSVLSPELEAFIMTPICAHSLHSRPMVFSDKSKLTLEAISAKYPLVLAVDGRVVGGLDPGSRIFVTKSDRPAEFIAAEAQNFFNKLLIKLNIWSK